MSRVTVQDGQIVLQNLTEAEIAEAADIDDERNAELDGETVANLH